MFLITFTIISSEIEKLLDVVAILFKVIYNNKSTNLTTQASSQVKHRVVIGDLVISISIFTSQQTKEFW